jgi:ABC-type uncharacterized transport system permease subunit
MVTIKRIDPTSAMKVGGILNALLFTIFGLLFFILPTLLLSSISTSFTTSSGTTTSGNFMGFGLAFTCIFYGIGVVASAISGAIVGLVSAFLYNLTANWVGGLQVELNEGALEKPKRSVVVETPTGFDR